MSDLVEFLLARVLEETAIAQAAADANGRDWTFEPLDQVDYGSRINGTVTPGNWRGMSEDRQLWDDEGALGMFDPTARHIAHWDPARVLAECAAKRISLFWYLGEIDRRDEQGIPHHMTDAALAACLKFYEETTLQPMASAYVGHPDFQPEWRI